MIRWICILSLFIGVATATLCADSTSDSKTRDALSEIEGVSAATKPASGPDRIEVRISQPEPAVESTHSWSYWRGLIFFFAPVLITSASIGIAGSVLGTFVVLRREALLALAMPQVVAAGAALGLHLGWPTLPPAMVFAGAALLYLAISRRREAIAGRASAATVPALYISGLSISFLIIAHGGAHVEDLQNIFTGIDVAVTPGQAAVSAPILLATALCAALLWRRWLLFAQAPAAAELAGLGPAKWDAFFLLLLTIVLLLGTNSQGVVLVLAMLFLPAAIVLPWASRIPTALAAGALTSLGCLAIAFVLSNELSWPLSQTVGGMGFALFVLSRITATIVAW